MTARSLSLSAFFAAVSSLCLAPIAAAFVPAPPDASAPVPTAKPDHWNCVIELPGHALSCDLDFFKHPDGTITGDISIPEQNAKDLPLENITIDETMVTATIKGIPGEPTFKGKIQPDKVTVKGDFTQGGATFPFTWTFADTTKESADALAGFTEWADQARKDWHVPGLAIAIIKDGQVVLNQGLGARDLDSSAAVTPDTLFAIGSCTKAFTTFTLGTLVDEGKLSWDKPVRTYLPEFKLQDVEASEHMTPRDLVTHRSGLPRHDLMWYNSSLTRSEMVGRLQFLEPNKEFRETWQYNNLMFLTAGYLAERVSGKSWEEAVNTRIIVPLGMSNSNFSVKDSQKSSDFASPYEWRDEKMRKIPFRDISQIGPAGSINSSINDMTKWATVHLAGGKFSGRQVIASTTLDEIHRPQMIMPAESIDPEVINIGYAMGWFVSAYRGHLMVEHGGNIDGFSALVTLLPKDHIGIVALTNMSGAALPKLATFHALDRLLGEKTKNWSAIALQKYHAAEKMEKEGKANKNSARKEGTTPSHPNAEFAGDFENSGYGIAHVTLTGDQLAISYNNISAPLNHWHYDTFVCGKNEADPVFEDQQILFRTNIAGDIDSLEVALDPTVKPIVFHKKASAKMTDAAYLAKFVGDYEMGPQVISVTAKGNALVVTVPGQSPYDLAPAKDDLFNLKGLSGFSLRFITENGQVSSAQFIQPNGVFTAKRK